MQKLKAFLFLKSMTMWLIKITTGDQFTTPPKLSAHAVEVCRSDQFSRQTHTQKKNYSDSIGKAQGWHSLHYRLKYSIQNQHCLSIRHMPKGMTIRPTIFTNLTMSSDWLKPFQKSTGPQDS